MFFTTLKNGISRLVSSVKTVFQKTLIPGAKVPQLQSAQWFPCPTGLRDTFWMIPCKLIVRSALRVPQWKRDRSGPGQGEGCSGTHPARGGGNCGKAAMRSEEHTSELQSPCNVVCRLLLA